MGGCGCTNSKTGEPKKRYATKSQADVACTESRQKYADGDNLNTYYCPDGKCWHVGNSSWDDFDESNTHYGTGSKVSTATIKEIVGTRARQQGKMRATPIPDAAKKTDSSHQPPIAQGANSGLVGCLVLVVIIVVVLIWMFSC